MNLIKVHKNLLQTAQGKAVVKKYNKVAILLTEYELVHYRSWVQIVDITCSNLQVYFSYGTVQLEIIIICHYSMHV